jgi:hypothetical protein
MVKKNKNKDNDNTNSNDNDNDSNNDNNSYLGIDFLVDKYIPGNVDDIIDPVYDYYENISGTIDNDWKNMSPSKCYFHKEILHKLKTISSDDCLLI